MNERDRSKENKKSKDWYKENRADSDRSRDKKEIEKEKDNRIKEDKGKDDKKYRDQRKALEEKDSKHYKNYDEKVTIMSMRLKVPVFTLLPLFQFIYWRW